jgi:hypothetical protein
VFFGEILMATSLAGWQVLFLVAFSGNLLMIIFFS